MKYFQYWIIAVFLGFLNHSFIGQKMGTINGTIVDENLVPIENANIILTGSRLGTISDKYGKFTLQVPSEKKINLKISHAKFLTKKQSFFLSPAEIKNIQFELSIPTLNEVEIEYQERGSSPIEFIRPLDAASLSIPSANLESLLPSLGYGVSQNNELSAGYNVRGGNFDENLIYVNDIEVYRPFLARAGQQEGLSFINPTMINNILFSAGGFDAKYGDKLSSVLDIEYTEPNQFKSTLNASLLGVQVHVQDKISTRFNFNNSIRYRKNTYLINSLDTKGDYQPSFIDYQGFFNYYLNENWKMSFFGTYSNNKFNVVPENRETNWGSINEALRFTVYYEGQEVTQYETYMGAISLNNDPNDNLSLKFITSIYETHESEYFDLLGEYRLDELERDLGSDEYGNVAYNRGVGAFLNHARNKIDATVINAYHKGRFINKNHHIIEWGAKYQHEIINDRISEWDYIDSARFSIPHPQDSIGYTNGANIPYQYLHLSNLIKANNFMETNRVTGYIQDHLKFTKPKEVQVIDSVLIDNKYELIDTTFTGYRYLSVTAGARANYWDYNNQLVISPRVSFQLKPAWYEIDKNVIKRKSVEFRFATGLYYQPPFYRAARNLQGQLNPEIRAQRSIHFVLGGDYIFKMWNRPFKFGSEVYYKHLNDIIPYEIDNIRVRYYGNNNAKGYATGIDLKINGEFVKGIESYASLSWLKTEEDILDDYYYNYYNAQGEQIIFGYTLDDNPTDSLKIEPGFLPRPTDQRVSFAMFFQDQMPEEWNTEKVKWNTFKVNLNLVFGTRLPYGPPGSFRYADTLRSSLYRRLDIGFSKDIVNEETDRSKIKKGSFLDKVDRMWIAFEVFNLLDISNTTNYTWIKDVTGRQYSIPSFLTSRRLNLKLVVQF